MSTYLKNEWRKYYKIPGMMISSYGRVRRIANFQGDMDYFTKNSYSLKTQMKNGKLAVRTQDHGWLAVDKMVESCFHGTVEEFHEVVHKDGDEMNCRADNLTKRIRPEFYEDGVLVPEVIEFMKAKRERQAEAKKRKEERGW